MQFSKLRTYKEGEKNELKFNIFKNGIKSQKNV